MQDTNIQSFTPPPFAKACKGSRNSATYHKVLSLLFGQEQVHSAMAAPVYYFTGVAG
jgi:hypothetical protein